MLFNIIILKIVFFGSGIELVVQDGYYILRKSIVNKQRGAAGVV